MIKNKVNSFNLIVILTILFTYLGYAQKGKVTYIASTKPYFKAIENNKKENYLLFKKVKDNSSDLEYVLTFNNKKSLFKINDKMKIENKTQNMTEIYAGKGLYYYENDSNITVVEKDFMGEFFLIEKEKVNWKLTNDTRKVGRYNCYKAISEITVETRKGIKKKRDYSLVYSRNT